MEKNEQIIAAIDIGTTKIASVVATKNNGKFKIKGFGNVESKGIRHGVVRNVEETVKAITNSINKLGQTFCENFEEVYVGIAGQYVRTSSGKCRILVNGNITKEHLEELRNKALDFASPNYETIDAIAKSYILDDDMPCEKPVGQYCKYLSGNFHIISGQTVMVNSIKECVNLAGLEVKSLFLEPLASADAVLSEVEKKNGVVLVDIGGGTTDVAIFKDGEVVHTAVIPLGGASITNDIADKFSVNDTTAEKLKCMYGSAVHISGVDVNIEIRDVKSNTYYVSCNEMSEVIQTRMEEILNAVKFQIETIYEGKVPDGIVLTGGGSLLSNLNQLATFILANSVRFVFPSTNIEGVYSEQLRQPQYSTLVGLLIKGDKYNNGLREKELIAQAKIEAERKAAEEEQARIEAERKAAEEEQARIEAERKAAEEEQARIEAERKAAEEEQARIEAERKAVEEEQARIEAERKAAEEEEAKRKAEEEEKAKKKKPNFISKFVNSLSEMVEND